VKNKSIKLTGVFQRVPDKTWPGRVYPKEMFQDILEKEIKITHDTYGGKDEPCIRFPKKHIVISFLIGLAIGIYVMSVILYH
jgi:hypothetical protein